MDRVRKEIGKIIVGQQDIVDGVLICLMAGGHVLLEGVPGLGKTTLLRTLGRVLHLRYSRIQFTPDLMPADIVGSMIIETDDRGARALKFQPGPIFAHLVLADEINRATPKTQSALLEAMQERTVTSGTTTHHLEAPFLVMATQNPIEMEGTYPLPEAQLDRFLMKLIVTYPSRADSEHHRRAHHSARRNRTRHVIDARRHPGVCGVRAATCWSRSTCRSTRSISSWPRSRAGRGARAREEVHPLRQFAARRAGAGGVRTRARADERPRSRVSTDDIRQVAPAVLRHRIIMNFDAHADGQTPDTLLNKIMYSVTAAARDVQA